MATTKQDDLQLKQMPENLANHLGVRRTMTLKRIIRQTGLPPEVLLDLALEMLAVASRKLAPSPIRRQAVGLGTARWRYVSAQDRSDALRRVALARWAKQRSGKNDPSGQVLTVAKPKRREQSNPGRNYPNAELLVDLRVVSTHMPVWSAESGRLPLRFRRHQPRRSNATL
jgi:hypothetical protein